MRGNFGRDDPREMPAHFFYRSLRIDYGSAVRADPERQNCSICPAVLVRGHDLPVRPLR
jgi:hypothetical protein